MGTVAASGGYYIAAATGGIVANPGTLTGSIGVIMGFTNFRELLDKIGLIPVVVKSGEYKDLGSPTRPMTPEEQRILQEFVDQIHLQFVTAVSEGRKMEPSRVAALADGRIFSGQQAKDLGLIDRLGNLEDAVEWAGRQGGIQGKIETVTIEKKEFSLLELLTGSALGRFLGRIGSPGPYPAYLWNGQG
jgi:protease-4